MTSCRKRHASRGLEPWRRSVPATLCSRSRTPALTSGWWCTCTRKGETWAGKGETWAGKCEAGLGMVRQGWEGGGRGRTGLGRGRTGLRPGLGSVCSTDSVRMRDVQSVCSAEEWWGSRRLGVGEELAGMCCRQAILQSVMCQEDAQDLCTKSALPQAVASAAEGKGKGKGDTP